jgi:5-methylcytosine-specific restriction endonuclease McrA
MRALLLTQPLNTRIPTYIEQYEDCLKKNYPESKLLVKNITSTPLEINNSMITKNKKKKAISSTIKKLVWNTNIGEEIGKSKCLCCKSTDITQLSFNCGHIIAESNGGDTIVSNLKPICQNCNSSMGTKSMNVFMASLK